MTTVAQRSFAGGELAPALYARTDQQKYATGARTLRNMVIQKHGGARLRPGMVYVGEVKDSSKSVRLLKFVFNDAQTYVMEFGENYIRWMQSGGRVATSGDAAWVNATVYAVGDLVTDAGVTYYAIAAHTAATATNKPGTGSAWQTVWAAQAGTIYEIPTPYLAADLPALQIAQSADVITITHPAYAPRELQRYAHTKWVLSTIVHGPSIAPPTNLALGGGAAGTIRYWAVTAIKEGSYEESLATIISSINRVPSAGTPTSVTWNAVAGAISYNVYRSVDGQTYGLINSSGGTPVVQSDTAWTDNDETASSAVPLVWAAAAGQARNPLTISATTKAYDGKYTVKLLYTLALTLGGTGASGRMNFYYSRDGEVRVLAATAQVFLIQIFNNSILGPVAFEQVIDVPDNGYSALTIDVVPEVYPFDAVTCTMNVNMASAPDNEVTWWAGQTGFSDAGDTPDMSLAPPAQANLFSAPNSYPAAVTHYQQRTIYGGSNAEPEKVYASRTGSFKSFTRSTPLQDDDAVSFQLAGKEVNAVKHFLDLDLLIAFTSSEVKVIRGDGEQGILRPDAINPKKIAKHGIGTLRPIEVADSAIYVQSRGNIVRDLKPVAAESYEGTDLTVFAAHLFAGKTVVDWDYAEVPNSIIWAALSDGSLVSLTYLREHGIWAWTRHDTDGDVENVCTVPEGDEDRVYLVVKRTINGATKRYIERMASGFVRDVNVRATPFSTRRIGRYTDMIFMDSALTYNGWNTGATTLTLSGGTDWDELEQLTLTASAATFVAGDVGNRFFLVLTDADGNETDRLRLMVEAYTSATVVAVRPDRTVPAGYRSVALTAWARAVDAVSGLAHLNGKAVSVVGDGYVVASPNNTAEEYDDITVAAGAIALSDTYAVIHVGLPYVGDLETLDIDLPGPRTVKDRKTKVERVILMVEETRGIFVGPGWGPSDDDPLENLQEPKVRDEEDEYGPIDLVTGDLEVTIESSWDSNGRLLVRQVDPLPLTVSAIAPIMTA